MRTGLLSDLSVIGYAICLEGGTIRLRYQKQDTPPESARQLIDELRKHKAEAVNVLKTDNTITHPAIAEPRATVGTIWVNPYKQGTPEARKESLHQVMMAIWESAFDRVKVVWPRGFLSTQEICNAEIEIERVQTLILSGKAKLADFCQVVEVWEQIVIRGLEKLRHLPDLTS
jgi:hypothetical protein